MPDGWSEKRIVMDRAEMARSIRRMAHQIVERNGGTKNLVLIGIRTRGVPLAERIADEIAQSEGDRVPIGILDITLYRDDLSTIAPHPVVPETRFPGSIDDRRLVLCDDVLYTGRTVRSALGALIDFGRPERVELAVLVDRGLRELPIQADYVGEAVATTTDDQVEVRFEDTDSTESVKLLERAG